jgi:hypothetical protein
MLCRRHYKASRHFLFIPAADGEGGIPADAAVPLPWPGVKGEAGPGIGELA